MSIEELTELYYIAIRTKSPLKQTIRRAINRMVCKEEKETLLSPKRDSSDFVYSAVKTDDGKHRDGRVRV